MKPVIVIAALLLAGCANLSGQVDEQALEEEGGDRLAALASVTARDGAAALAAARLAGDTRAIMCWETLVPWIHSLHDYRIEVEALQASGTAYLLKYQRARNVRRFVTAPPEDLDIACAPMLEDNDFLGKLVRRLGLL